MATTVQDLHAEPAASRGRVLDPAYYQHERYLARTARSRPLSAYYAVKPLIPGLCSLVCAGCTPRAK